MIQSDRIIQTKNEGRKKEEKEVTVQEDYVISNPISDDGNKIFRDGVR